jgi:hypothetical protein
MLETFLLWGMGFFFLMLLIGLFVPNPANQTTPDLNPDASTLRGKLGDDPALSKTLFAFLLIIAIVIGPAIVLNVLGLDDHSKAVCYMTRADMIPPGCP